MLYWKNFNLFKIIVIKRCVVKMDILQLIKFFVNLKVRLVLVYFNVIFNKRGLWCVFCFEEEKFGGNKEREEIKGCEII